MHHFQCIPRGNGVLLDVGILNKADLNQPERRAFTQKRPPQTTSESLRVFDGTGFLARRSLDGGGCVR